MASERVNVGVLPELSEVVINTGLNRSEAFKVISKQRENSVIYSDNLNGVRGRRFWDDAIITAKSTTEGDTIFELEFTNNLETYLATENETFVIKNSKGIAVKYGGVGEVCAACYPIIGCIKCNMTRGCEKGGFTMYACPTKTVSPGTYTCNNSTFQQTDRTKDILKSCWTFSTGFNFYKIRPIQNCIVQYQNEYIGDPPNPNFII